jgi:hypothetical protein
MSPKQRKDWKSSPSIELDLGDVCLDIGFFHGAKAIKEADQVGMMYSLLPWDIAEPTVQTK